MLPHNAQETFSDPKKKEREEQKEVSRSFSDKKKPEQEFESEWFLPKKTDKGRHDVCPVTSSLFNDLKIFLGNGKKIDIKIRNIMTSGLP